MIPALSALGLLKGSLLWPGTKADSGWAEKTRYCHWGKPLVSNCVYNSGRISSTEFRYPEFCLRPQMVSDSSGIITSACIWTQTKWNFSAISCQTDNDSFADVTLSCVAPCCLHHGHQLWLPGPIAHGSLLTVHIPLGHSVRESLGLTIFD